MKYNKPFKTFSEQKEKLKNDYKLKFNNENLAEYYLKIFPYYNIINGYKEYFMTNEKYTDTTLEKLIFIHLLDKSFLNIIFKYSTYVEDIFKHKLSYIISKQGDKYVDYNNYLNLNDTILFKKNYNPKDKYYNNNLIKNILNIINSSDEPTYHYKNEHNHIPSWILFKNVNFFHVTEFFNILNHQIKLELINEYRIFSKTKLKFSKKNLKTKDISSKQFEILKKLLVTVRKFRNQIGHNLKVYNYKINSKHSISTNIFNDKNLILLYSYNNKGDLYSCFISILILLDNELLIIEFINDILNVFNNSKYVNTYLNMYNLPNDFIKKLEKLKKIYSEEYNNILNKSFKL